MSSAGPRFDMLHGDSAVAAASKLECGCFEHPAWVQAVAAARARPHRFVVVHASRPGRADAWLIGAVHRRAGLTAFESMPMAGYGGWLCQASIDASEERELHRAWLARASWPLVVLTSRPGSPDTLPTPAAAAWLPARWCQGLAPVHLVTHVLDLSGDDAALLQRARPRMRTYLRGAGDAGFRFERRGGPAALSGLHAWYVRGSSSWRTPSSRLLPEAFFVALAADRRAEVWTIFHREREVGAALFLGGRGQVQYQASGTERLDVPLSAMEAMLWHAARHYRDRGFASLNLGASAELDSVARFKEKFGATPQSYLRCTYLLPAWARAE